MKVAPVLQCLAALGGDFASRRLKVEKCLFCCCMATLAHEISQAPAEFPHAVCNQWKIDHGKEMMWLFCLRCFDAMMADGGGGAITKRG